MQWDAKTSLAIRSLYIESFLLPSIFSYHRAVSNSHEIKKFKEQEFIFPYYMLQLEIIYEYY